MAKLRIYRQRHPEQTALYQCLEGYWDEFKQAYEYFYEKDYGPLRPVVQKTVGRFLECGIFRNGFARIRCPDYRHEYLLAFSCKTRYFCPSCQVKRVAVFVEWVTREILELVDHRQYVWTIPKVLRPTFRRDRHLLGELARCAWRSLRQYFQAVLGAQSVPGAILAIQTYGDQLNFHPHLHSLVSDVAWDREGSVFSIGWPDPQVLTQLFQHHVLEMLISQRRLSREFAVKLCSWHHSGFQVYCGRPVDCKDDQALERLSAYILRPSFAGTRLQFDENDGQVEYRTTKGVLRCMDALDWIAFVTSHIPSPHEQMVRYYGRYSNASRGKRRTTRVPAQRVGSAATEENSSAEFFSRQRRQSWARLLKRIYEVDR